MKSSARVRGDINNDGFMKLSELMILMNSFGKSPDPSGYNSLADFAAPIGTINLFDVMVVVRNWGAS